MDEDSDRDDYLQDPELWGARLPQPYRMIDKILNQFLEKVWEHIEHREVLSQQEAAKVKVPEGRSGEVVCGDVLTGTCAGLSAAGEQLIFTGNGQSVCVVATDPSVGLVAQYDLQDEVIGITAAHHNDTYLIVVQHSTEMKILGYLRNSFVEVADFHNQNKEDATIVGMTVSSSFSHIGVSWRSASSADSKLSVYQLPVGHWVAEFPPPSPAGSQVSVTSQRQNVEYSKPVLLYSLSSPIPPASATSHPYAIFQSVCEHAGEIVPSGELHSLTKTYFENRRRVYALKRQPFVEMASKSFTGSSQHQLPHLHFLHFHKQAVAHEVVVWWEGHSHLTVYPLEEASGKSGTVSPTRRIPQASTITCSCVSEDSSMLAVGLETGVVVTWDMKLGLCSRVVACVMTPDRIAVLKFFPSASGLMVAIGTKEGKMLALGTAADSDMPAQALHSRVKNQQQVYNALFASCGYNVQSEVVFIATNPHLPLLVISVHANGVMVVWNASEHEAVCTYSLGKPWSLSPTSHGCMMSDNGHFLFVIGKVVGSETDVYNVVRFNLHLEACLASYWERDGEGFSTGKEQAELAEESGNCVLLDLAERHLRDYVTARLSEVDQNLLKWQEHWKDLPNRLVQT